MEFLTLSLVEKKIKIFQNFREMPQCFPFNIQLSIGTAISAIPYQLLITFGTSLHHKKKCSNSSSESRDIYVYVLDRYIMFITTYEHNAAHCLQKSFHLIYLSFFLFLLPFLSLSLYLYPSHPLPLRRRSSSTIHTHTHTHIQI